MTGTHVVRRQLLELRVADREAAAGLQDDVQRAVHERLRPAMDAAFSRLSPADEVVRLERVELDLGRLPVAGLADELVRRTLEELDKVLGIELAALRRRTGVPERGGLVSAEVGRLASLRHFLETGRLPWQAPRGGAGEPEAALAELLADAPGEVVRMLRTAPPSVAATMATRIVKQFTPDLRRRLAVALAATGDHAVARVTIDDWQRLFDDAPAEIRGGLRETPAAVVDRLIRGLVGVDAPTGAVGVCELLVREIAKRGGTADRVVRVLAVRARRVLPSSSEVRRWLERRATARDGGEASVRDGGLPLPRRADVVVEASAERLAGEGVTEGVTAARAGRTPGDGVRPASAPEDAADAAADVREPGPPSPRREPPPASSADARRHRLDPDDAIIVDDAGLVVLAPFLPGYLAKLGLVFVGQAAPADSDSIGRRSLPYKPAFVSPAAHERAVLLLRYLATGRTGDGEQHLALDKLLCGWPLSEPVERAIEPSGAEAEESRELLASVVEHWKALGRTSVDGLRSSFLSREGRLTDTDGGWKLEVPRTGYDVLLDQIPWGISLVRLPWMDRPLFVEW